MSLFQVIGLWSIISVIPIALIALWWIDGGYKRWKEKRKGNKQRRLASKQGNKLEKYNDWMWYKLRKMISKAHQFKNKQHRHHVKMSKHYDKENDLRIERIDAKMRMEHYSEYRRRVEKINPILQDIE